MSSKTHEGLSNDVFLDTALRPTTWEDYVGQSRIKENLKILFTAATQRKQPPEHILFYGPPGLGKTTLAHLLAREINATIKVTSGPAIEKIGDLASILTNLSPGDMLFVDEIHRLSKVIEEVLYPAMESGTLDIIIGKGPSARTIQLELSPFTLVAATTRIALLSSPLRSRFSGGVFRLEYYSNEEIKNILKRSAKILKIDVANEAYEKLVRGSRSTPRIANYLLKRCRDFAQVTKSDLNNASVNKAFELLEIDNLGLTALDRKILNTIILNFNGGPVGISTIAAAISEEESTIMEVNEPYLIQIGLLERTPRGRLATKRAYEHLGVEIPEGGQEKLL